jgi:tRNA(fMet)-specific endonuclease VapC
VRYLLDKCVPSHFARGESSTLKRVKASPPDEVAVSSITAMEVEFGLALDARRARRVAR